MSSQIDDKIIESNVADVITEDMVDNRSVFSLESVSYYVRDFLTKEDQTVWESDSSSAKFIDASMNLASFEEYQYKFVGTISEAIARFNYNDLIQRLTGSAWYFTRPASSHPDNKARNYVTYYIADKNYLYAAHYWSYLDENNNAQAAKENLLWCGRIFLSQDTFYHRISFNNTWSYFLGAKRWYSYSASSDTLLFSQHRDANPIEIFSGYMRESKFSNEIHDILLPKCINLN